MMLRHVPTATLLGIMFEGVPHDRSDAFVAKEWIGLDEGVPIRRDSVNRPSAHGQFSAPGYLEARVLGVNGYIIARSPTELIHKTRRLKGLLADGGTAKLALHGDRSAWISVGLAAQTSVTVRGSDPCVADFQIHLWAPDPRMYGEVREFPAGTPALHYGNFPAIPELIITGTMPSGYSVHGPDGKQFIVSQALSAGQTHRLDFRTGRLYRDNVLQIGAVSNGGTWTIPVGTAVPMTLAPVSGAGSMTVRVPDTFI